MTDLYDPNENFQTKTPPPSPSELQHSLETLLKKLSDRLEEKTQDLNLTSRLKESYSKLLEHQLSGISWMSDRYLQKFKGVILADEMGCGKTVTTAGFVNVLKSFAGQKRIKVLIEVPKILEKQWHSELTIWCPNLSVLPEFTPTETQTVVCLNFLLRTPNTTN